MKRQPIETAPRDGWCILASNGPRRRPYVVWWDDGAWVDGTTNDYGDWVEHHPTHWEPLPQGEAA